MSSPCFSLACMTPHTGFSFHATTAYLHIHRSLRLCFQRSFPSHVLITYLGLRHDAAPKTVSEDQVGPKVPLTHGPPLALEITDVLRILNIHLNDFLDFTGRNKKTFLFTSSYARFFCFLFWILPLPSKQVMLSFSSFSLVFKWVFGFLDYT